MNKQSLFDSLTVRGDMRRSEYRPAIFRRGRCLFCVLLMGMLFIGAVTATRACPPGVFDYGSPCPEYAGQVIFCQQGSGAPLIPDPEVCARVARDMALIDVTITIPCDYEPNVIIIHTPSPQDPELVCMNLYYQVEFSFLGFDDAWMIRFPHPINVFLMTQTYDAIPAVQSAYLNGLGSVGIVCDHQLNYTPFPNGTWHWNYVYPVLFHTGCRNAYFHVYISESGQIIPPGDLNCDGIVDFADVPLFVEALISPAAFSGCDPYPADVNGDGASDAADVQSLIQELIP